MIASSPTDLQPVMDAVAENAARVCGASNSAIFRLEGEHLRVVARHGTAAPSTGDRRHHPGQSRHRSRAGCGRPADDPRRGPYGGRNGVPDYRVPREAGRDSLPNNLGDTAAARGHAAGRHLHQSRARGSSLLGQADRAPRDVRQPGRDRHRERPSVHGVGGAQRRAGGVPRAADGDGRDPAGDRELADQLQPALDAVVQNAARVCGADDVVLHASMATSCDLLRDGSGLCRN